MTKFHFKCRYLGTKRGVKCLVTFRFKTETVDEAIQVLNKKETRLKCQIRCYETKTGYRIIGGELQKNK